MSNQFKLVTEFFSGEPASHLIFKWGDPPEKIREIYADMVEINANHKPHVAKHIALMQRVNDKTWTAVEATDFSAS